LYHIVDEVYAKCKAQENFKDTDMAIMLPQFMNLSTSRGFDKIAQMLSSPEKSRSKDYFSDR
jgi:amidophosphoribosyltransferase